MVERVDVVVVGSRCAGAPLATLLARAGVRVAVLERAVFPRDTLSTHIFQAHALAFLDRLGVTERLRATGAPFIGRSDGRTGDLQWSVPWPQRPGDVGGAASIRRTVLDPILAETASQAGADVRFGSTVTGVLTDYGRVTGVRVDQGGIQSRIEAPLVVGADGRNSTIASLVGARKYNLTSNQRFVYWSFYEHANPGSDPAVIFHHWAGKIVIGCPADNGLYQVIVIPELAELPRFRAELDARFHDYARQCAPVAEAITGARRVGKFFGMLRWEGFFREACGPGWVLVGDSGYFKDPTPGQGIGDAYNQVDTLAPAIVNGLGGSSSGLDNALAAWGRWRDEDQAEHYWFATDLGKAGPPPAVLVEVARRLHAAGRIDLFLDVFNHRAKPSRVLTRSRVLTATGSLLARRGCQRRALLREVRGLVAEDGHRKHLMRHPAYTAASQSTDAGPTEVDDIATVA
jgi:flavin-dependent dehydrogenase